MHVEPVSQWKGFSPGWTGMRAVYATSMAKRGFTGPVGLFEGPWGLEYMFAQSILVKWEDPSLEIVKQTVLKKYCSLIHGQPVIEAALDVKRSNGLVATDVEHVRCDTFQAGYDFAGGGTYGSKDHPWMKEQDDYNLEYLISAACSMTRSDPTSSHQSAFSHRMLRQWSHELKYAPTRSSLLDFPKNLRPESPFALRIIGHS